jgi:hypothetical protein
LYVAGSHDEPVSVVEQPALAVIGTGSLAREVCHSLAVLHAGAARVVVIGRRPGPAAEVCYVASARAAASGRAGRVRFEPVVAQGPDLGEALAALAPAGVLVCASTQSPWERLSAPSAWTALVERAGFGITLPLQGEYALAAGAALPAGGWLVNACYPDAVNPLLAARGVPVLCGVGNVGLLAASLQSALGLPDQGRLRVLGHHAHLRQPAYAEDEALAWCDGEPVTEVGKQLSAQRAADRRELNHITGLTAALVVGALLTGGVLDTSLPGPLGLPGGYPVRLSGGRLELRLPAGLTTAGAVAHNQRWAVADGAVVEGGRVVFSDRAGDELRAVAPELADGFEAADVDDVTRRMQQLRERLRGEPRPQ